MPSVYILHSLKANKYYIGSTKNFEKRLEYHLLKEFSDSYTAKYNDWKLYLAIQNISAYT